MEFKELVKRAKRYNKECDIGLFEKAYKYSNSIVKNKVRDSGQPFIQHYVDVAYEAAELKLDDASIAAALMHGLLNKGADKKEIKNLFGNEILTILENIERMTEIKKNIIKRFSGIDELRNVLLVASRDIRALLVKLCDKIVNLRDLQYIKDEYKKKEIAKECMKIYAPLAYRLGIGKIKSELEDLSFRYLDRENYDKIKSRVDAIMQEGETLIFKVKKLIENELKKEHIDGVVYSRLKHIYSIYRKIIDRSYELENIKDIVALRVIVKDVDDCYKVLKIIHSNFRPVSGAFKDYIAMPKPNGYQSLHTSVIDEEGRTFEVQIRTEDMHETAEGGIAAHFSYKKAEGIKEIDTKLTWLKQLVENRDSLNRFNIDFFGDKIFVFTPKAKAVELPSGSSVIDFAYHVHSDVGNQCTGAKVNGNFVSLRQTLNNGDIVEVIRSKTQRPSREWLKHAKTARARSVIRQMLREIGKVPANITSTGEETKKRVEEGLILFEGDSKLKIKFGICCKPLPGDKIIGIKNSNARLTVHKMECRDIQKTDKKKLKVGWLDKFTKPIELIIYADNRAGLMKELLNSIKDRGVSIVKTRGRLYGDNDAEYNFTVSVSDLNGLNEIISIVKKIKDVKNVYISLT